MKSDSHLQQVVLAESTWAPRVTASKIGVEVQSGSVTRAGHVDSDSERSHAERAAQRVSGVDALAVELEVRLPGLSTRTDADIALPVESGLSSSSVPDRPVEVMVEGGHATLAGDVGWQYRKQATLQF